MHLRDDLDRRVAGDLGEVLGEHPGTGRVITLLPEIADERLHDAQPMAGCALDVVCGLRQETVDRGADRPVPEEGDVSLYRQVPSPP